MARTKRTTRTTRKAPLRADRFATVRASAVKAVEGLYAQGLQLKARGEKLAAQRARQARGAIAAGVEEARSRTAGAVTQLEKVFQARVSAAIAKLGVPSARDVRALSRQVAELQQSVQQLRRARARAS